MDLPCSELVMDSGGGCGLIHGCCLCGVVVYWRRRGASAPTQQLSTSHVQTSSPADAQYTGVANRSVVGDRAQLQEASVSVFRNLRFKILIKTDKQFHEQYSIPGTISFSFTYRLRTRMQYVLLSSYLWVSHLQPNFTESKSLKTSLFFLITAQCCIGLGPLFESVNYFRLLETELKYGNPHAHTVCSLYKSNTESRQDLLTVSRNSTVQGV